MSTEIQAIGRVVTSKAGRDKGRSFLITGVIDENHVYVVDGTLRKLLNPKKKKLKHLTMESAEAEGIREKLTTGKQVFDAEIRNCLIHLGFNQETQD